MAQGFYLPFQQIFDSKPTVRPGAGLFFYASGTSSKLDTFSDAGLSIANPTTLTALGVFRGLILAMVCHSTKWRAASGLC